jgi:predicted Zn-dependent protease with MMP-like domain
MERDRFQALVEQSLAELPEAFRVKIKNAAIIIEDTPPQEPGQGTLLLGLFHGVPRTSKSVFSATPPDHIYLYQRNIEAVGGTDKEIKRQVRDTLLHELGHYFGLNEEELRGI